MWLDFGQTSEDRHQEQLSYITRTPQHLAQEGEMGAPMGILKQCAKGRDQDRTHGGGAFVPKATFPIVTTRLWVDGWRLFFLIQRLCQRVSVPQM